jgi:hypothetical protein
MFVGSVPLVHFEYHAHGEKEPLHLCPRKKGERYLFAEEKSAMYGDTMMSQIYNSFNCLQAVLLCITR